MIIYGVNAVIEALRAGRVFELSPVHPHGERIRQLVADARAAGVSVVPIDADGARRLARGGLHQGVIARVSTAPAVSLDQLMQSGHTGWAPLLVVLDGVEDPQNVGAIIRSVNAAGGTGLVRQTRRAAALGGAAAKASAGAVHHVPVADVVNIARALEELKAGGVWTVGLDAGAKVQYDAMDLTLPTAIVVGAEGSGLRRLVRERCDTLAAIPMRGQVGSLNVSVAAAIMLFEAVRQRDRGRPGN